MRLIDLTNRRFGRLLILARLPGLRCGKVYWACRCDCGQERVVVGDSLRSGRTTSCGCYHLDTKYKHGLCGSKAYEAWHGMIQRCHNPRHKWYRAYGGRGIRVCKRWRTFLNFFEDMGQPPSKKHSLDRINNDRGYFPGNCRWATPKQQSQNSRAARPVTYKGKTQYLKAWATELGIRYGTLRSRLYTLKWPIAKAFTTPVLMSDSGRESRFPGSH